MMSCFRKVLVFVCLISLLPILCISSVTGDEVDDNDTPLPDLKFKNDIIVRTDGSMEIYEPNLEDVYDALVGSDYTITFTVENDGEADAKNVTVDLWVVYYDTYDYEIREFEDNSTPMDIKAGNNTTVDFTWSPLQYTTQYTVIVSIYPGVDYIPEEVENYPVRMEQMLFMTAPNPVEPDEGPGTPFFNNESLKPCIPIGIIILVTCSVLIMIIHIVSENKSKK